MDGFISVLKYVAAIVGILIAAAAVGKALSWFRGEFYDQ
jgi:hypothetical protein